MQIVSHRQHSVQLTRAEVIEAVRLYMREKEAGFFPIPASAVVEGQAGGNLTVSWQVQDVR